MSIIRHGLFLYRLQVFFIAFIVNIIVAVQFLCVTLFLSTVLSLEPPRIAANLQFVNPDGGGWGRGECPLKLKKMAHMHKDGKRIGTCSACAVAQNKRTCANVNCGRQMYCVIYGTRGKKEKEKRSSISIIRRKKKLIIRKSGNSYSNFQFLIITKTSGGLAAMTPSARDTGMPLPVALTSRGVWPGWVL